jgi:hypothetical protein
LELKDLGHLATLEAPRRCVEAVGLCIDDDIKDWCHQWEKNRKWRQMGKEDEEQAIERWMMTSKSRI